MRTYDYIIVGGGMAGSAAVMGIRKHDKTGSIALISEEAYGPYNRPPLSKSLWGKKKIDDIIRPMDSYQVDMYLNTSVVALYPDIKQIVTQDDEQWQYGKLLLATGGHPRQLPGMPEGLIYYRNRADYAHLRELVDTRENFCIIGGGFIGSELAAAINQQGKRVTMIFPEIGISGLVFPDDLSKFVSQYYIDRGIDILAGQLVSSITASDDQYVVRMKNIHTDEEQSRTFDAVIVGIGILPNTQLAKDAGLVVDNGILVNPYLQTSEPDIYTAGDNANFYHAGLKKHTRVEHEDNANAMGMLAGENMAGSALTYDHFPFFYSDLFDLGYEALGELNKNNEIVSDWIDPYKKGTIYYLEDGRIRGLIFWNLWGKVEEGAAVITEGKAYAADELKGMFGE